VIQNQKRGKQGAAVEGQLHLFNEGVIQGSCDGHPDGFPPVLEHHTTPIIHLHIQGLRPHFFLRHAIIDNLYST
jgi:hypothetical protein